MPVTTTQYVYPTSVELDYIDQDLLPVLEQNSNPIFQHFPLRQVDAALVEWEQRQSYYGLMQARGLEGSYPVAPTYKINRFSLSPGRYGEYFQITGKEIEERRGFGAVNAPINIKDLVIERQEESATRMFNQMAYIVSQMVTTGNYIVTNKITGATVRRDGVVSQSFVASTAWSSVSTATPLANFRAVKLLHRGHSIAFDNKATAYMNTKTFNNMIANSNANDLGGRRSTGLETIEGLHAYNQFIALKDNLPKIVEYDEGYLDDTNTFVPFIPDNTCVVLGRRLNGAKIGEMVLTRNADNGNSSAPLFKVVEHGLVENSPPPVSIQVYRGWNGGPRINYANAIAVMTGL